MHYYQFNIGDYVSHTRNLSPIEDLAYRRMLDLCYLTERPLNACSAVVKRDIGLAGFSDEIEYVLSKFFVLTNDGYTNSRVDKDISSYKNKRKQQSDAGKASAKSRKNKENLKVVGRTLSENSTDVEPTINHKPITNNQKPPFKKQQKEKTSGSEKWLMPSWLNQSAWTDFEQHRKEIKKPLSDLSRTKAANTLKNLSHSEQQEVIDKSINARWAGLFPKEAKEKPFAKRDYGKFGDSL